MNETLTLFATLLIVLPVTLTLQDDLFIAPCCLLALPTQYQQAEPQQDSLLAEVGFSCACSGRGPWPQWPRPAGA
jgi:hypothetical protein